MTRNNRRRKYFIKKGFQARFIARFLAVSFVGVLLALSSFNFLAYKKIDALLFSMTIPADHTGNGLFREAIYANCLAFIFIVFAYILTAKGVHAKMVRSLHRIRADIHGLIRGDLGTRIQLSEDEEFRDLANDLNLMAGDLQRRFSDIKKQFEQVDESMRELRGRPEEEAKIIKERIMPQIATFEERLSEFIR